MKKFRFSTPAHRVSFMTVGLLLIVLLTGSSMAFGQRDYKKFFSIGGQVFTIDVTRQTTGLMKADLYTGYDKETGKKADFQFFSESYEVFFVAFETGLKKVASESDPVINLTGKDDVIKFNAQMIYRELVIFEFTGNEIVPMAGYIHLSNDVMVNPNEDGKIPCRRYKKLTLLKNLNNYNLVLLDTIFEKLTKIKSNDRSVSELWDSLCAYHQLFTGLNERITMQSAWRHDSSNKVRQKQTLDTNDAKTKNEAADPGIRKDSTVKKSKKQEYCVQRTTLNAANNNNIRFKRSELTGFIRSGRMNITNSELQIKQCDKWISMLEEIRKIEHDIDSLSKKNKDTLTSQVGILNNSLNEFVISNLANPYYHLQGNSFVQCEKGLRYMSKEFLEFSLMDPDSLINHLDLVSKNVDSCGVLFYVIKENCKYGQDSLAEEKQRLYWLIEKTKGDANENNILKVLLADSLNKSTNDSERKIFQGKLEELKLKQKNQKKQLDELKDKNVYLDERMKELTETLNNANEVTPIVHQFKVIINPLRKEIARLAVKSKSLEESEKTYSRLLEVNKYKIDSVHLEFNDGVLKNIITEGTYLNDFMVFSNPGPIQFTAISHIEKLRRVELIDMEQQKYKITLSDVMAYVPALQVDNEDYCPSDSVYNIATGTGEVVIKQAMKERVNRILDARVYTDLVGFGAGQNNGLIQFEVSKKIPLFTHRIKYNRKYRSFVSFAGFYEPKFTMAKLEQNNKYYYPLEKDDISGKRAISTIDVYKYASMRMAALYVNLFCWEVAEVKSSLEVNGGFSFLYTPVRDSISQDNIQQWGAVSGLPFGEVRIQIKPDVRYGFTLSSSLGWLYLWDDKLKLINDPANPTVSDSYNRKLLSFQFDAFFRPFRHSESAAFFRLQNVHTFPMSLNYLQAQVGFAFNIFGGGGKK